MSTTSHTRPVEPSAPERPAALRILDGDTADLWPTVLRPGAPAPADDTSNAICALRAEMTHLTTLLDHATLRATTAEATQAELRDEVHRLTHALAQQTTDQPPVRVEPDDSTEPGASTDPSAIDENIEVEPAPVGVHRAGPNQPYPGASRHEVQSFLKAAAEGDIDLDHMLALVHVLARKEPDLTRAAVLVTRATAEAAQARREAERYKNRLLAYAGHVPAAPLPHAAVEDLAGLASAEALRALTQRAVETHLHLVEDEYATGGSYIRDRMESDTEAHWADLHGYSSEDH